MHYVMSSLTRLRAVVLALAISTAALVLMAVPAFAQTGPIGELQSAATSAATQASGLVVAVVVITLAVIFGLWAIRKARSG